MLNESASHRVGSSFMMRTCHGHRCTASRPFTIFAGDVGRMPHKRSAKQPLYRLQVALKLKGQSGSKHVFWNTKLSSSPAPSGPGVEPPKTKHQILPNTNHFRSFALMNLFYSIVVITVEHSFLMHTHYMALKQICDA